MTNAEKIIEYYRCYKDRDLEGLRSLLTPDFRHVSPFGEFTNRDQMLDTIWPSVTGNIYADDIEVFGSGPAYLVRYQHKGHSSARIAEYFWFEGTQIAEVEVYLGVGAMPQPE